MRAKIALILLAGVFLVSALLTNELARDLSALFAFLAVTGFAWLHRQKDRVALLAQQQPAGSRHGYRQPQTDTK